VRLILTGRPGEKPEVASARSAYLDDGDAKAALRQMPRWCTAERAVLEALARKGVGACLPACLPACSACLLPSCLPACLLP
jgi:tRNA(Glu) U13 pseudouridine synthase TruD